VIVSPLLGDLYLKGSHNASRQIHSARGFCTSRAAPPAMPLNYWNGLYHQALGCCG